MKLLNLAGKIIVVLIFIAIISTLFSISLSPKDKALEYEAAQYYKLIELSEDQINYLNNNGLNVYIDDQLFKFRYEELGVNLIDNSSNIEKILSKFFGKPQNYEVIIDEDRLYTTIETINENFESKQSPKIEITNYKWVIDPIKRDRYLDYTETKEKIIKEFGNEDFKIDIKTKLRTPNIYAPNQIVLDSLKDNLTAPIYIEIFDFGEIKKYKLNEIELFGLLTPSIVNNSVDITINESYLNILINEKLKDIQRNQEIKIKRKKVIGKDTTLDIENISKQAYEIIKTRINRTNQTDKIIYYTKYSPFTNGDKFEKYIEVDLSQKMLYVWEDGILKHEMLVSIGFNNTTPKGEYQIQNKADNPYSDIDNSYMPYWMSFHKDSRFNAWLGFHALTHKINSKGKYIYEPETNLGGTTSGGCIKLGRKEAEILYNWAKVGDRVYIHD